MKHNTLIFGVMALFLLSACEKLDREVITGTTEKQVTESYQYAGYRQASLYTDLPEGFLQVDRAMMASANDEAEFTNENANVQKFNNGSWNAYDNPDNAWGKYYKAIRKANQFLVSIDSLNLDTYRLSSLPSDQIIYQQRIVEITRWKLEARFLRAYFYFELVKRYGGVPIFTSAMGVEEDFSNVQRNTLEECINFIVKECDSTAVGLPAKSADADLGRATKGAALGLKSRVLLYAASDLFNDPTWAGGYDKPELISLPAGNRTQRWKDAANAAKAVLDIAGAGYWVHWEYAPLFNTFNSPEIILTRRNGPSNDFEKANFPIGYDLGQSGNTPSQNLVDAYEMNDGTPFDWNNPVHAANPYANRDPRLGLSITTNNAWFNSRSVELWAGGRDGKGIPQASKTGYYLKKYLSEYTDLLQNRTSVHSWLLIRTAEIFLNYAEALNECEPGNPDIRNYIGYVRGRTTIGMPNIPAGLSQPAMRERIRNERRVEFAFEDHRTWDVRRWLQGPQYFGTPLRGVDITRNPNGSFTYVPTIVEQRVFEPKMYLYPIPQGDLFISPKIAQNPLW
ncbi:RagB/SusD family nutrient uptake outer membrane protein [Chitinophaga sp. SYP-B3965]|uniref:RagB/SusD family nutrient uptake outer membrane protein n=1 Tax=Chitinophaga sp. SYP-B3965 TaxID=2663120 RepID=UPI001299C3FB|nr:RagB/SusD family nutrient uptake outer membrane protein [Chitinophaga sp. SYP-B3965]MRG45197.1 RagB/SusD family nutrient uptake outer membrane protein [Chitinophaga sp. SYP-B3965]